MYIIIYIYFGSAIFTYKQKCFCVRIWRSIKTYDKILYYICILYLNCCIFHSLRTYRTRNRLLQRLLGVTVLPLRTLDTLTGVTQTRSFTVGTIGARNGVGILLRKSHLNGALNLLKADHVNLCICCMYCSLTYNASSRAVRASRTEGGWALGVSG